MKKVVSLLLVFAMLLSAVCAFAAPVAEKYDGTSIVNVTGKVASGDTVNVLLKDGENVKYINEFPVEKDGTYRAKFKFKGETDGLSLAVKQGDADVTDSVISAVTESEAFSFTFGATTLKSNTMAVAEFENYFNIEGKTYVLMIAFYDKDGRLISVKTTDKKTVNFNESSTELVLDIPEGTETVKSFMWGSIEKMIPLAKEKTTKPTQELKVLAIGNSFTDDPYAYLKAIAEADGVTLNLTKAQHGGSSIIQHWTYYKNNEPFYSSKTVNGETVYTKRLQDYIDPELNGGVYYDIITFQQVSGDSGKIETYGFEEFDTEGKYDNCAENLAKALREHQPSAEIVLQETWAYEVGYSPLKNYSPDSSSKKADLAAQNNMYAKIVETVQYACEKLATVTTDDGKPISLDGKPLRYIPTGDAFQYARQHEAFQTEMSDEKYIDGKLDESKYVALHRDGYHSSHLYGRYLGGLVWYSALTGNSPVANKYNHVYVKDGVNLYPDPELAEVIKHAAQDALDAYGRWN